MDQTAIQTVMIGGDEVRVVYLEKKSSYTDAQKRAIYKYREKNREALNEQHNKYYYEKKARMKAEKDATRIIE